MNDVMRELECAIEAGCGAYREVEVTVLKYARDKLLEQYALLTEWDAKLKSYEISLMGKDLDIERLQGALKAEERHNELTMECAKKALANARAEAINEVLAEIEKIRVEYLEGKYNGVDIVVKLFLLQKKYTEGEGKR